MKSLLLSSGIQPPIPKLINDMPVYQYAMIIDDDDIALLLAERLICMADFARQSHCFQKAETALKWIEDSMNQISLKPDIILVDLHMKGMDGYTFLKKMDDFFEPGNAPNVYVLSSTIYSDDRRRLKKFSFVKKIIMKPLKIEDL